LATAKPVKTCFSAVELTGKGLKAASKAGYNKDLKIPRNLNFILDFRTPWLYIKVVIG